MDALLSRAARGAFWLILSGTGARALGILGTLAVTRYVDPERYGEVTLAALVIQIAQILTNCGVSQFIASRPKAGRDVIFHATFFYLVIGAAGLALTLLLGDVVSARLGARGIARYLPAIVFAGLLDRVSTLQDRVQLRALRFRSVGAQRAIGDLTYTAVSVGLAAFAARTPFGGAAALVWAIVARSVVRVITLSLTTPRRDWLSPSPIDRKVTRDLFAFGLPMAVVTAAAFGAQNLDNLVFELHFGLAWLTFYKLAYNFADLPAALIGEQIGDVLVPSFAHLPDRAQQKDALLLSLRVLPLLVAPLAVGLAVVAPTLAELAFAPRYQDGVTRILRVLAMISVARTFIWIGTSYLQVRDRPRTIMILEVARMIGVVVLMHLSVLAALRFREGAAIDAACAAVVLVFALSGLCYASVIRALDGVSLRDQMLPLVPSLLACVPMILAVLGARRFMMHLELHAPAPRLVVEVAAGAAIFVPSALALSPRASRELRELVQRALRRRAAPNEP